MAAAGVAKDQDILRQNRRMIEDICMNSGTFGDFKQEIAIRLSESA